VLLYLESIGNPRKFSRLARRIGRRKPIVAVKAGRSTQGVPLGHSVRESRAPYEAVDAMFRQAGVLRVDTIAQLFDVAQVLTSQPLPSGPRVAVLGNSTALGLLAADACRENGLVVVGEPVALPAEASADEFAVVLAAVFDDPAVDSVVAVFIPPLVTPDEDVAAVLASAAARATKTVVATFTGMRGVPGALGGTPGALPGEVPAYPDTGGGGPGARGDHRVRRVAASAARRGPRARRGRRDRPSRRRPRRWTRLRTECSSRRRPRRHCWRATASTSRPRST
jgi:hypothetical protein